MLYALVNLNKVIVELVGPLVQSDRILIKRGNWNSDTHVGGAKAKMKAEIRVETSIRQGMLMMASKSQITNS